MTAPRLARPVTERDHAAGPADAPVTLVEYGDYECPHCGRAHPIVKRLLARAGDRVRFVYRNFPLSEIHPHAMHAAEAAEAVPEAGGEFWTMHDELFAHQHRLDDPALVAYASAAGADPDDVAVALAEERYLERVRADFIGGVRSGVNGTPTFFINGERHDGPWDEITLLAALDLAAAGATEGHAAD
ncbi:MAG TPA: thioredoxin domain-containing protein [Gemmatimonadaceae bacterium]|nr:thioredoxin domain-containing protein [Gemmatimonadaceae bacterium]